MNDTSTPRVSVVIPARNRATLIGTAIDSVLTQTFNDFELIVVDDGSTDDTVDVVRRYTDPRIRLVHNDRTPGIPGARNCGAKAANGHYIASLDSDDTAYPERLTRQVDFLDRHENCAVVGSWTNWIDSDGRRLRKIKRRPARAADAAAMLIFNSSLAQPSAMIRTDVMREFYYDEAFAMSSDYELWARMAPHHEMLSLPRVLVCCRNHGKRTTQAKQQQIEAVQRTIQRRQLDRLGIEYTDDDVRRHQFLPRSAKKEGATDLESFAWAEDWLLRLRQANRDVGLYDADAFDRVIGWAWSAVCYRTIRYYPRHVSQCLLASPLRATVPGAIAGQLGMMLSPYRPQWLRRV